MQDGKYREIFFPDRHLLISLKERPSTSVLYQQWRTYAKHDLLQRLGTWNKLENSKLAVERKMLKVTLKDRFLTKKQTNNNNNKQQQKTHTQKHNNNNKKQSNRHSWICNQRETKMGWTHGPKNENRWIIRRPGWQPKGVWSAERQKHHWRDDTGATRSSSVNKDSKGHRKLKDSARHSLEQNRIK